jgi:hypothetical protein
LSHCPIATAVFQLNYVVTYDFELINYSVLHNQNENASPPPDTMFCIVVKLTQSSCLEIDDITFNGNCNTGLE